MIFDSDPKRTTFDSCFDVITYDNFSIMSTVCYYIYSLNADIHFSRHFVIQISTIVSLSVIAQIKVFLSVNLFLSI